VYFIAVENCGSNVASYLIASVAGVAVVFPPFIALAVFQKKDLHVFGGFFGDGAVVLLDGQPQETIFGEPTGNFQELIVKKGKKNIARRQSVLVTVKSGNCSSAPFLLTRP
jgi:hypothetical protein